ncbi:MAG: DUF5615 family PIN-like protein [bacterium]
MSVKISFYADENIPPAIVAGLRHREVDVLTTKEAGMLGASDDAHLELANVQQRVIITKDVDFLRLHAESINHSGIVHISQERSIGDIIRGLMLIYQVLEVDEMQNHIEFL